MLLRVIAVSAFCSFTALAFADPYDGERPIEWPKYLLVGKSYDATLSCSKLNEEIDKVDTDITALHKAKVRVEDALRLSIDTQNSAGREEGGVLLNTAVSRAGQIYTVGRAQVRESLRIAEERRDHLETFRGSCQKNP